MKFSIVMCARHVVVMVLVAVCSLGCWANDIADLKFVRLTSRDGLSCGNINGVYQDSVGCIWIGTGFGLNRYDGTRVKVYYNNPNDSTSLAFNNVYSIMCDYRGHLWLSQLHGAYCTFNPVTEQFDQHPERLINSWGIQGEIYKVFIDDDKCFWICTKDKGVFYYNPLTKETKVFKTGKGKNDVPEGEVASIIQYKRSVVMTYKTGVIVSIDSKARYIQWKNTYISDNVNMPENDMRVDIDDDGNFWIRTGEVEMIHVLKSKRWYTSLKDFLRGEGFACNYDYYVRDVKMDFKGNHWIGTDHGGLIVINMKTKHHRQFVSDKHSETALSGNTIQNIYRDRNNKMWLSTYKNGLNQWADYNDGISTVPLGDICTCLEERSGIYWLGSNDRGLIRYERLTGNVSTFNTDNSPLLSNTVIASCKTNDGTLWFGTYQGGLVRYKDGKFKIYTSDNSDLAVNHVWCLLVDAAGYLWIGTMGGGIYRMNVVTEKMSVVNMKNSDIASDWISSLTADLNGNIVAGTSTGLAFINSSDFSVTNLEHPADGISRFTDVVSNQVMCDSRGLIWICTTAGLNVYDQLTGKNYILNNHTGLGGTVAYGVAEDQRGNVWVVTEFSVSKVNVKLGSEGCQFVIANYDYRDGLQKGPYNQRSITITSSGKVLIGGLGELDIINLGSKLQRVVNPKVIFSDIELYGEDVVIGKSYDGVVVLPKELNFGREVFLKVGKASISIFLASSDCSVRGRTRYTYWVEGLTYDWMTTSEETPMINLNGLTAGTYYVHVKALTDSGDECSDEAVLTIHVTGPLWRSWWAMTIYIILALCLVIMIYNRRQNIISVVKKQFSYIRNRNGEAGSVKQLSPDEQLRENVMLYVEQHISDPDISVVSMGRALDMSHVQLYSELTRVMKVTPSEFIRETRIRRACELLKDTDMTVVEIAFATGFRNMHDFVECFTDMKGVNPKGYRQRVQEQDEDGVYSPPLNRTGMTPLSTDKHDIP